MKDKISTTRKIKFKLWFHLSPFLEQEFLENLDIYIYPYVEIKRKLYKTTNSLSFGRIRFRNSLEVSGTLDKGCYSIISKKIFSNQLFKKIVP